MSNCSKFIATAGVILIGSMGMSNNCDTKRKWMWTFQVKMILFQRAKDPELLTVWKLCDYKYRCFFHTISCFSRVLVQS